MVTTNFEDFYEVPNLNFDIPRLRDDLDKILKTKKFNSPGVTHFGAISLNQNDPDLWNLKGIALRSLGRYNEAVECFNKSLEIDPRDKHSS